MEESTIFRPAAINSFVRLSLAFNSPALFHKNCVIEFGEQGFHQHFGKGKGRNHAYTGWCESDKDFHPLFFPGVDLIRIGISEVEWKPTRM